MRLEKTASLLPALALPARISGFQYFNHKEMLESRSLKSQVHLRYPSLGRSLTCKPVWPIVSRPVRCKSNNREGQEGQGQQGANLKEDKDKKEQFRKAIVKEEDEEDDDEEFTPEELTTAVTLENCTKAGVCTLLCALLGELLNVDFTSAYRLSDTQDALLGLQASLVLALATTALLLVQPESKVTKQTTNPSWHVLRALEMAENKLDNVNIVQVKVDLHPFARGVSRPDGQTDPEAMTDTPFATGLRLFQLWFTKPYLPNAQLTLGGASLLLPSSALFLAANELLLRGLSATLIARWAQDVISQADSSSFLFWFKVFGLANEGAYRWLGALAVGALSIWATVPAAERAQTWARALLQSKLLDVAESYANEEEDSSSDEDDDGSATGGHDASHSNSSSTSVPGHGSTSSSSSTSDYGKVGSADGISSSSSSSNGKEENSSSNMAEDGADSIQALVYNAATGQMEVVELPTHDDEGRQLVQDGEPTQEDEVVYKLVAAYGIAQVLQVTILFGLTGNLLATLTARLVSELFGIVVVQSFGSKEDTASGERA